MKKQDVPRIELHGLAQKFEAPRIDDLESHLAEELEKFSSRITAGSTISLAVVSRRLYDKIDLRATLENAYTSSFLSRAKVPIVADSDEQAIGIALRSCGAVAAGHERIMRIRDTLHLEEIYVSEKLLEELRPRPAIQDTGRSVGLVDCLGNCPELW